jgi:7,8-dihydro-6-hydroxymethylpterin dimethyltransferase
MSAAPNTPSKWSGNAILTDLAGLAWKATQAINCVLPAGKLPTLLWASGPIPKSFERSRPPLGLPRVTDSICPRCNTDLRDAILRGDESISRLKAEPGLIKAHIIEESGRILMRKVCKEHGLFEDVISTNPDFFRRLESLYLGRDSACSDDGNVHGHGVSSIKYGRGSLLVVDLTNRCNMKCTPCYMNANQLGYVHELGLPEIRGIFDRALSFKPRREINVLFAGGEPTMSPFLLHAIRYARGLGFKRLLVATNGIKFAQSREFAAEAHEAGLHGVYLQFDGVSEEKNRHRGVGNLFEVKLRALENIAAAGMRTSLQSTVINGINSDSVGSIVRFAIQNIDRISGVIFQPIMFSGRDREIDAEARAARRYTLSQLAEDLKAQCGGQWEPMRDWFPISCLSACTRVIDMLKARPAREGSVSLDAHPNWSMCSFLVVNRRTKHWVPLSSFFDFEQFVRDLEVITDSGRGRALTAAQLGLAFLRNHSPQSIPSGFALSDALGLFRQAFARVNSADPGWGEKGWDDDEWRLLTVNPTFFQDAYNIDLRNIEMAATPVGTEDGEISFCAYYSMGWKEVVERLNRSVPLSEWHRRHGRHEIFAGGKLVPLEAQLAELARV